MPKYNPGFISSAASLSHILGADLPHPELLSKLQHPNLFQQRNFAGETSSCRASYGVMVTLSGPTGEVHLLVHFFFFFNQGDSGCKGTLYKGK